MPLEAACPCLLSWVLRGAEVPPFFRPEQGEHEETRRELVTLLKKKKKKKLEEGKVGKVLLSAVKVLRIWTFF